MKNSKTDIVVQKAVELGVDSVVPFCSAYTAERKFNAERARRIALEAAKQCGSVWLSRVEDAVSFDEAVGRFEQFDEVFFAYEGERALSLKKAGVHGSKLALVVGSEGGFRADEVEKRRQTVLASSRSADAYSARKPRILSERRWLWMPRESWTMTERPSVVF